MSDAMKKVQPGQPLKIPARAYNEFVDAANDLRARQQSLGGGRVARQASGPGTILIRNATGGSIDRFAVLQLDSMNDTDDPVIDPDDNFEEFARRPVFDATAPLDPHSYTKRPAIVIAQEPAISWGIVPAVIDGVSVAKVDLSDATADMSGWDYGWADVVSGNTDRLIAVPGGPVELVWVKDTTEESDIVWAIVRLGARPLAVSVPVVGKITAVDEDEAHDPPYAHEYKAETLDGSGREITGFIAPENERSTNVRYVPAAVDDLCLMWWDDRRGASGDGHILAFTEIPMYLSGY